MRRQRRRVLSYVTVLVAVVLGYTLAYRFGMAVFEGKDTSLIYAFQVVIESITTTGYGEAAPWDSPQMVALVTLMQFSGIFLLFLTLPLFVVPWIERGLEVSPPTTFDGEDHVVISGFSERTDTLIEELSSQSISYVILLQDRDRARELRDSGYSVAVGHPESTAFLSAVGVPSARAVVLDEGDEENASVALSIREMTDDVRVVAFVEERERVPYLELAGVDDVLLPRELLGRSLADMVTSVITTQLGETVDIAEDIEIIELPIQKGSALDGVTLAESNLRNLTGANIIGAWIDGDFVPNPDPGTPLSRNIVLLVSGETSQLEAVMDLTSAPGDRRTRNVIIVGYGEVGSAVQESLRASNIGCTIVDRNDLEGVDVVGESAERETLERAGIADAGALIVSLPDDTDAVFTTLVAREANEKLEIIARANQTESSSKLYSAGADYVRALATVSGRMLAASILEEDVISYETQIDIVRSAAPAFVGQTLSEAAIRERTGCTVIAVERNGEVHADLGPEFTIEAGDSLVLAGADEDIATFSEMAAAR